MWNARWFLSGMAIASLEVCGCGRVGFPTAPGTADATPGDALGDAPSGAVAYDRTSAGTAFCTSSPCNYDVLVGPGANSIIVIWYFCANGNVAANSIAYDGALATFVAASNYMRQRGELWYARPTVEGNHTITLNSGCSAAFFASMSATNVDPVTPFRATTIDGTDVTALTISDTVDSAPGDLVMDGVCHGNTISSASASQNLRYLENLTGGVACGCFGGSTQPGASPAVSTLWTGTTADFWVFIGVSLKPAS
jgi:hypothetical protein